MKDLSPLDEPPPVQRYKTPPQTHQGAGRFSAWLRRPSAKRPDSGPGQVSPPVRRWLAFAAAALVLAGSQAWTLHGLAGARSELSSAHANIEELRGSLGTLWAATNRLDKDQLARLALLEDSIRSVFMYAQGEVRLWETAYYTQEQRIDEQAASIARNLEAVTGLTAAARTVTARQEGQARLGDAHSTRLDLLERQDRTQVSLLEALARRTQTQESNALGMTATVAALRDSLASLDAELVVLEDRLATSGVAHRQMDERVDGLAGWVDGFRRAGLSGKTLDDRLAALTDELRRVRLRVDSLRPLATARVAVRRP